MNILNPDKNFTIDNHPFMFGLKGYSYQTFSDYSGRTGYQLKSIIEEEGFFTITYGGSRPTYRDGLPYDMPTTGAEKSAYFSGRIINSLFSVPFHAVRTIVDISLQIIQTIAFVAELSTAKLASKFSITYNPCFASKAIVTIRNSSGCCGAINELAERLFLIRNDTAIKSFSSIIRNALTGPSAAISQNGLQDPMTTS